MNLIFFNNESIIIMKVVVISNASLKIKKK